MLTEPMLRNIHALLPGADARSYALRRLVRTLARDGGEMSLVIVIETLGAGSEPLRAAQTWDGVRLSGCGLGATLALSPWVRRAVGLEVSAAELLADLADDPPSPGQRYIGRVATRPESEARRDEALALKIDPEWLRQMAEKEDNGIISVGGLVTRMEAEASARLNGYGGDPCPRCHKRLAARHGAALACDACGHRWSEAPWADAQREYEASCDRLHGDPLAEVRARVARARNVSEVGDAIAHSGVRFRAIAGVLPP